MKKFISVFLSILAVLFLFSSCGAGKMQSDVYITEVMAKNKRTIADEKGNYSDWIEIYNPTSSPVNLEGYTLSNDIYNISLYKFPAIVLQSGEYLVVFADKTESYDPQSRIIHVPFTISAKGETISLYNSKGSLRNTIRTGLLGEDESMGLNEKYETVKFTAATPGKANCAEMTDVSQKKKNEMSGLVINEYSTTSTQTVIDDDGDFVSWVELYNGSDGDIDLKGCALSDDSQIPDKWVFSSKVIKKGEYLVIYLSGKEKSLDENGACHASFKLSGKEDMLILNDQKGQIIDSCKVYELISNLTCGRPEKNPEKFSFFSKATPGKANNLKPFDSINSARYTSNKAVSITEVAAVNTTAATGGAYYDYIEIHNNSKKAVNLKDYKLSDSKNSESFRRLPPKTVEAGEYAVIYCGDSDMVSSFTGNVYTSLGLSRYGETVYLLDKNGTVVDSLKYTRLSSGYSSGRDLNSTDEVVYYGTLTPGKENPKKALNKAIPNPEFSKSSTYLNKGDTIAICAKEGDIYYTTDGSIPTKKAKKYTEPITINKNTVLRAKAFKSGNIPSDTICATYLVGKKHTLPVVLLTTDNDNLYGYTNGIWADGPGKDSEFPYVGANYWKDWERPVNFEYMTADGVSQLSFDAGIRVFGQFSRALEQKSVSVHLRDKYGPKKVCYPFFEDGKVNVFSSFILRNSGQDFTKSHIRDAFCARVIKGSMDVDIMDYAPVVAYVNGKYHGIYDLREKINEDYLANHYAVDKNNIDLIKGNDIVQSGSIDNYNELLNFIKIHDMTSDKNYEYVKKQIDIDELINYWICESFFTNTDTGNIRFWRENKDGAKWRWIFFDADWALYPSTYTWNYIENYLDPNGHGVSDAFDTTIMRSLYKNKKFRKRMLELHSKALKTTFDTDRMLKIYDGLIEEIKPEMKAHCERWDTVSYKSWESSVNELRDIIKKKRSLFIKDMKETFNMTQEEIRTYLDEV